MTEFAGKQALVTGGGTGVGAAVALALARAGATVTITGRREEPLQQTAKRHPLIRTAVCDVTDSAAVADLVDQASGESHVMDIVVANAGAAESIPFKKITHKEFQAALDVNLLGVFNVWQAASHKMAQTGWGRMIAIASTAGLKGYGYVSAYCAAKHGVIGMTRSLALEMATTGITVNAICPGYTETPMLERTLKNITEKTGMSRADAEAALKKDNPQNRFIQPGEVADTVKWLCSDGARSVTGQAIVIAGGEI